MSYINEAGTWNVLLSTYLSLFSFILFLPNLSPRFLESWIMPSKIEFKILKDKNGNDIDLRNMSLPSTRAFLILLRSLTNIVNLKTTKDVNIKILEGSAVVVAEGADNIIEEIEKDFNDVVNSKSVKKEVVENWREIQTLFKENGLEYEANFYRGADRRPVFENIKTHTKFKLRTFRNTYTTSVKFISGKLIEIGGQRPNIHVTTGAEIITIDCSEREAINVNRFLYQPIQVCTWKRKAHNQNPTYAFCDFYINEGQFRDIESFFIKFQSSDEIKKLELVHEEFRKYAESKNWGVAAKWLRPFNNECFDVSTLKTVLIITKSFKETEGIREIREAIKQKLEHKIGNALV